MRHLALVGATASGKSSVALAVAQVRGDVEIVSLDSMQVYRGMDVGTAKPTHAQRARVPHHLVDVADPAEEWSVARTQQAAREAITAIEERGGRALLVGGTGLYVQAVVDGLSLPGEFPALRAELEAQTADPQGLAHAYTELQRCDPVAASRILPANRRRIVRALEVCHGAGRPFSSFGAGLAQYGAPALSVQLVGVAVDPAVLASRIADRVAAMRSAGLLDEVRRVAARPGGLSRTARQAIGYKELLAHLDGACSLDEAFDRTVRRTRQFARRQRVWFRRDPRIAWLPSDGKSDLPVAPALACWDVPVDATPEP